MLVKSILTHFAFSLALFPFESQVHAKAISSVISYEHEHQSLDLGNTGSFIVKRVNPGCPPDPNPAPVPSMLDAWNQAKCDNNVVPLGTAKTFKLDVTQAKTVTTVEYYGCTVIIIPATNKVLMAHYAQFKGNTGGCVLDSATQAKTAIVEPLSDALAEDDFEEEAPVAIIARDQTVLSSAPGLREVKNAITGDGIQSIQEVPYQTGKAGMNDDSPTGKAVVQWIPKSNGGATMHIYVSSLTPKWSGEFGTDGVYCG